jgi:hypothetical protein
MSGHLTFARCLSDCCASFVSSITSDADSDADYADCIAYDIPDLPFDPPVLPVDTDPGPAAWTMDPARQDSLLQPPTLESGDVSPGQMFLAADAPHIVPQLPVLVTPPAPLPSPLSGQCASATFSQLVLPDQLQALQDPMAARLVTDQLHSEFFPVSAQQMQLQQHVQIAPMRGDIPDAEMGEFSICGNRIVAGSHLASENDKGGEEAAKIIAVPTTVWEDVDVSGRRGRHRVFNPCHVCKAAMHIRTNRCKKCLAPKSDPTPRKPRGGK